MEVNRLLKWLIPTPVAAGSICLTMKLTNQANTSLLGLGGLDLEDLPEIKEKTLQPTKPPAKPAPAKPAPAQPNSGSGGEKGSSGGGGGQDGKQSQSGAGSSGGSPSGADGAQVAPKEIEDILKEQIGNINTQSHTWISRPKELSSVYGVISNLRSLLSNLEVFKNKTQKKTEGAQSPGASAS